MGQAIWLEERRKGVGGSDVAAIVGLSPWKTAFDVWEEKLGLRESSIMTPAMRYGTLMEPVIRQWYSDETGRSVRLPIKILQHGKYPFMLANLDGVTDDGRVIEIKTAHSSQDWGEPGSDEIPDYYRTQVEHYLCVTGLEVADVVVSFGGTMPVIYTVEADKELHEELIEREAEFWELVETKTPPEPVTLSDLVARFRKAESRSVVASEEVLAAIELLRQIKASMDASEFQIDVCKATIMKHLGEADTLVDSSGKVLVTWKQAKDSNRFNSKKFQQAYPDIYESFIEKSDGSRRFLIK